MVLYFRDNMQPRHPSDRNYSGPISYRQRRDTNNNTLGFWLVHTSYVSPGIFNFAYLDETSPFYYLVIFLLMQWRIHPKVLWFSVKVVFKSCQMPPLRSLFCFPLYKLVSKFLRSGQSGMKLNRNLFIFILQTNWVSSILFFPYYWNTWTF